MIRTFSRLGFVAMVLSTPSAFAALGADVSSVQSDRMEMKAVSRTPNKLASYTVHEMTTPAGTVVREYANTAGTVFGIAWQGPTMPNLRQILGNYFETYKAAARSHNGGRNRLSVHEEHLIARSTGHMRAFSGNAYDPTLLPAGVNEGEIK